MTTPATDNPNQGKTGGVLSVTIVLLVLYVGAFFLYRYNHLGTTSFGLGMFNTPSPCVVYKEGAVYSVARWVFWPLSTIDEAITGTMYLNEAKATLRR